MSKPTDRRVIWQEKQVASGKCRQCGKRKLYTTVRCKACAELNSKQSLARYYEKKA